MARPRQWSDIDRQWLSGYLIRKGLGKNFNLGSDALVADVAERLSGEEWRAMRQSWTTRGRTVNALSAVHDSEVTQAPEVPNEGIMPLATDRSAGLEKAISGLKKLQQKALGDWDAFGELLELPTDLLESIRDQSATPLKFLQAAHGKPHVPEPPNQRVGVGNVSVQPVTLFTQSVQI
jgi:hypothetical protein